MTDASLSSEQSHYRVVADDSYEPCKHCGSGTWWTIESNEGVGIGTSWGDAEQANDICDLMNMAYDAGLEGRDD